MHNKLGIICLITAVIASAISFIICKKRILAARNTKNEGIEMKNIILSADCYLTVYSVPAEIADNLRKYCLDFRNDWLPNSPDAKKYRRNAENGKISLCYDETDFIKYLNKYVCKNKVKRVEKLKNVYSVYELPEKYKNLPYFNF